MNYDVSTERIKALEECACALKSCFGELEEIGRDLGEKLAGSCNELGPYFDQIEEIQQTYMETIMNMEEYVSNVSEKLADITELYKKH